MKIYLLDREQNKTDAWCAYFNNTSDVEIVTDEFSHFMQTHNVDGVVSPANAFGMMDGGYDEAITLYFGDDLQKKVQDKIIKECGGHQTLGTAITVTATPTCKLIHVPTMCIPGKVRDPFLLYECMRSTLFEAQKQGLQSIVIPMFGGTTGEVEPDVCAKMMWLGYKHFIKPNKKIDWYVAMSIADDFDELGVSIYSES